MLSDHTGELAALFTAFCWTITSLSFEHATKRIGSFAVNLIRLAIAMLLLAMVSYLRRGIAFPVDASNQAWLWLGISGILGLTLGDFFLFKSFAMITSRKSQLMMTAVPVLTTLIGWTWMDEKLRMINILGIIVTVSGIVLTLLKRNINEPKSDIKQRNIGYIYAFLGAIGQALGLIFSKKGIGNYDPFAANQVRLIIGFMSYIVLITMLKKWTNVSNGLKNKNAMTSLTIGSVFGPFLGISFSLIAIQNTSTGIASTIMSITPILIIIPSVFIYKQKISAREIIGAFISVCGVALLFI